MPEDRMHMIVAENGRYRTNEPEAVAQFVPRHELRAPGPQTSSRSGRGIGILGGSFDPPHDGHLHITKLARRHLKLKQVWWMVSPGNPLKAAPVLDFKSRLNASRRLTRNQSFIWVTDIESRLGTCYTGDTLEHLVRLNPGVPFVWIMGADNLATVHRWKDWERIFYTMPIAIFARPGSVIRASTSPAARRFARARLSARRSIALALRQPPRWTYVIGPMVAHSSSEIRARQVW